MTALPSRKLEAWRYTDLRALRSLSFAPAPAPAAAPKLPDLGLPRLVFLNGVFDPAVSSDLPWTKEWTKKFSSGLEEADLPLARIAAEEARDGITLEIPENTDAGTILLVTHVAAGAETVAVHLRHRVALGAGAKLTIIEVATGAGEYWHNAVFDVSLQAGAELGHFRLQDESEAAFHLATLRTDIAAGAGYETFTAALGARLSRTEHHATLAGAGAHAHLNGALLLAGTQHGDMTSVVAHRAPGCASRQTVKAVLSDKAHGVFQGRIEVDRDAQKTDGYQMTQALLLSERAEMDIKPELQIFADDVKCSHGATIGALDPEQIFYLRSRGISEPQARAMLVRAFLTEALEPVAQPDARAFLEAAIETKWARS